MGYPSVYLYRKEINMKDIKVNEFLDLYIKNSIDFIKSLEFIGYPIPYDFNDDLSYKILKQLMNIIEFRTYIDRDCPFLIICDRPQTFMYKIRITNELKNMIEQWVKRYE